MPDEARANYLWQVKKMVGVSWQFDETMNRQATLLASIVEGIVTEEVMSSCEAEVK